ncbi:MAG: U32 family peptidase [Spirochaetales bacterium]|nr:U32 family peptidase [Spirochaetales bacterium]
MKKTELLAPAGNLASALAAYESGADAVYAGLGRFNAREMGENFDYDDMSRLSAHAKKLGKRFYITLNTLIKEKELAQVAESAAELAVLEPDAFIVQDSGVARMLRTCFPGQEIHGSTQMGIHNLPGIELAQKMGLNRIILERQVTLEELEPIVKNSPLEIEVFIHGALCCSLSGSCLFSSYMGGWSGNRGRCKQPCRRRYHGTIGDKKTSGFFFSTQDLYSLDLIPRYRDMGIASLKIEGRLRKPDYVKKTVQAYRMMLDTPVEKTGENLKKAKAILAGSYGRKWSHGFSTEEDLKTVVAHKSMGVSGLLVGEVNRVDNGSIKVRFSRTVRLGDRLRIQNRSGDEGPAFTITKMFINGKYVKQSEKGRDVSLPWDREEAPSCGIVYRIGESTTYNTGDKLPLFIPRKKADLNISLTADALIASSPQSEGGKEFKAELNLDRAEKRPLSAEQLEEAFRASRSEIWQAGDISVKIEGDLFFPAGQLKQVRRDFWEWLTPLLETSYQPKDKNAWKSLLESNQPAPYKGKAGDDRILSPTSALKGTTVEVKPINGTYGKRNELILPDFCSQKDLPRLQKAIDNAVKKGVKRFRVTSLYQLELLAGYKGLELTGSYPLPVMNSWAVAELAEYGLDRVQGWIELEEKSLKQFVKASPLAVEIYRSGRPALLSTRATIPALGEINDSRGKAFTVAKEDKIFRVYGGDVTAFPGQAGCSNFFDNSHTSAKDKDKETDQMNWDRDLV